MNARRLLFATVISAAALAVAAGCGGSGSGGGGASGTAAPGTGTPGGGGGTNPTPGVAVEVNTASLNVRTGPGTQYSILTAVSQGQVYVAIEQSGAWLKIWFDQGEAWFHGGYTAPSSAPIKIVAAAADARSGPGTQYAVVAAVPAGQLRAVVAEQGEWRKVWFGGTVAWIHESALAQVVTGPIVPPVTPPPAATTMRVSGWLPDWAGSGGQQSLLDSAGALDEVNPTWYALNSDGTLRARSFARDVAFVTQMHAGGVEVLPMIDDFSIGSAGPVVLDAAKSARLVQSIIDEVSLYGLDGMDIDFEGMNDTHRDAFSRFMADLSTELHSRGKILSAAIYPKTSEPGGWSGPKSHDYAALGAVVDRFKIMLYGYSGPISPLTHIDGVLAFAATQMPASKVYAGLPFFGKDRDANGSVTAAHTQTSAEALLATTGATLVRDASMEAKFTYTSSSGVGHTVFYQDGIAIGAKCDAAKQHGVAGIAIWRLGGEKIDIWDAIRARR